MEMTSQSAKALPARKAHALWIALGLYLLIMAGTAIFAAHVPIPVLVLEGLINGALVIAAVVLAANWLRQRM